MALTRAYTTNFASVEKIDDHTIAITTKVVESLFPYQTSYILMVSRCRAEALHYDWNAYAEHPSGTGPFRADRMIAHERLNWCQTRTTGIRSASRNTTGWCCC